MLEGLSPDVMDDLESFYKCDCSRERVERALISLGREELENMASEKDVTEVCCHFCSNKYEFTSAELRRLAM